MKAKQTCNKQYPIFSGSFFVYSIVSAQQNITGLQDNTGELLRAKLFQYSDNQNSYVLNMAYEFEIFSFYNMYSLGYSELNDIANGTLRFVGNSICASTLGSPESLITVDVQKPFNLQTGKNVSATLAYEGEQTQNIEFYSIEGANMRMIGYFFDEKTDNDENIYQDSSQNSFENMFKYKVDNFGYYSDYQNSAITENQEIRTIKSKKSFLVLIHYMIK
jgi:hypothetical protein